MSHINESDKRFICWEIFISQRHLTFCHHVQIKRDIPVGQQDYSKRFFTDIKEDNLMKSW